MSTDEQEPHGRILEHVARLLFDPNGPNDEVLQKRFSEYTRALTHGAYKSSFGRIVNDVSENKISLEDAALKALAVAVRANYLTTVDEVSENSKEELRDHFDTLISTNSKRLIAFARNDLGIATANEQAEAKILNKEMAHIVAGSPSEEGEETMPNPPESSQDKMLEEFHARFAFDESRLPPNLHYASDVVTIDGSSGVVAEELSEGQRNFLIGIAQALAKTEAQPSGEKFVFVAGLMLLNGHFDPDARRFYDQVMEAAAELKQPASEARNEIEYNNDKFETNFDLRHRVFSETLKVIKKATPAGEKIYIDSLASVGRTMVDSYDKRPPHGSGFAQLVLSSYNDATLDATGGSGGGRGTAFLDLPPLSSYGGGGNNSVVPENIKAVSAIHTIYQCEQMLLFAVVDRIAELFVASLLPMGGTSVSRKLDDYYWNKEKRISSGGRAARYSTVLGVPGGENLADVSPNKDFNTLLMRVISSIAEVDRQQSVSSMFDGNRGSTLLTSGEFVRKAIRDFASNCTLYGYSGAIFAAERMGRHLEAGLEILSIPRIQEIYGVASPWQVIERVAQSEFGKTVNIVKHRTLAEETRNILEIIARKPQIWSASTARSLFTFPSSTEQGDLDAQETQALFRASQYFLAVNGITGEQVREYSQPTDTMPVPSLPGFGSSGAMPAPSGGDGDVAGQLKNMISRGETPSVDQIRSMIGM